MNYIHPKIAAEILYTARFQKNERKEFDVILNKFGNPKTDKYINDEIEINLKNN